MYKGERLNSITHLVGAVLALMGLGALLTVSIQSQDPWMIASFTVFGFTLVLLYTVSTLYHSFSSAAVKRIFRKLDHVAIYLLIAGTYTPYMLVSLRDSNGPLLLVIVWGLALLGIMTDTLFVRRIEVLQVLIYLVMGWSCVPVYSNLQNAIPPAGMAWLVVGGVTYTIGILFYVLDGLKKLTHAHGIWHFFVLFGSLSHFISIIGYVR